jgi:hypothetical protein
MQIGKIFISKIYKIYDGFVFGLSFDISNHFHYKNENETSDIIRWVEKDVDEFVITIEFLFWGIDIQISRL